METVLKRYCQTSEDKIIDWLLRRIGMLPGRGVAVEIGAGDGWNLSNTRHLAENYQWELIQIDGKPGAGVHRAFVTADNINAVLDECGAPQTFGVLSIDIDGNDWWVWRAIDRRPAVVCVEFNGACPPGEIKTVRYDPAFRHPGGDYYGASFAAMRELGRMKGYRYVREVHSLNAFFVLEHLAAAANITAEERLPDRKQYHAHREGEWVNPFEEPMKSPDPSEAFNRDHHLAEIFRELVKRHGIKTIIETGTYFGHTTAVLAGMAQTVVTIESDSRWVKQSSHLGVLSNVLPIHGDSPKVMPDILKGFGGRPILLFLDAHWNMPTPTPHELRAIAASGIKPAVIVIHDVQVPGRPEFGFDTYPDFTYNWATIKPLIEEIYGDGYTHRFNDQPAGANRGALIVEHA